MSKNTFAYVICFFAVFTNRCADPHEGVVFYANETDYQAYKSLLTGFTLYKNSRIKKLEQLAALSLYDALRVILQTFKTNELSTKENAGLQYYLKLCADILVNISPDIIKAEQYVRDILDYSMSLEQTKANLRNAKNITEKKYIIEAKLHLFNNRYTPIYYAITKKYHAKTKLPWHIDFDILANKGSFK